MEAEIILMAVAVAGLMTMGILKISTGRSREDE